MYREMKGDIGRYREISWRGHEEDELRYREM